MHAPGGPAAERRARVYQTVRSAHLERFHQLEPARVFFVDRRYDFEAALLEGLDIQPCRSHWDLFRQLFRARVDRLEINEPLMIPGLKNAAVAVLAVRLAGLLRRHRTTIVTYAIENSDPFVHLAQRLGWRTPLYRLITALIVTQVDRLAFGTEMAEETYAPHLGRGFRGRHALVPALPAACEDCPGGAGGAGNRDENAVVFVGSFTERKGIRHLLEAWPLLLEQRPGATLQLIGKGPLQEEVLDFAKRYPSITVLLDPPRAEIHRAMAGSHVAVLLSIAWRGWREQVGLPLVEALSHGCEVVTTDQTGLASWLAAHGHQVVDSAPVAPRQVAEALVAALDATRPADAVLAALPSADGRLAADQWMFTGAPA